MQSQSTDTLDATQLTFFKATFAIMGYIAKTNGHISKNTLTTTRVIMQRLGLKHQQILSAIEFFNEGKQPYFNFINVLDKFRKCCQNRKNITNLFLLIQIEMTYADKHLHMMQRTILMQITEFLGFSSKEFARLESIYHGQQKFNQQTQQNSNTHQNHQQTKANALSVDLTRLRYAYQILGVSNVVSESILKTAYRKALGQYHPDKLVSKGLPEEMIKIATDKTIEIKRAYQYIKDARATGELP